MHTCIHTVQHDASPVLEAEVSPARRPYKSIKQQRGRTSDSPLRRSEAHVHFTDDFFLPGLRLHVESKFVRVCLFLFRYTAAGCNSSCENSTFSPCWMQWSFAEMCMYPWGCISESLHVRRRFVLLHAAMLALLGLNDMHVMCQHPHACMYVSKCASAHMM